MKKHNNSSEPAYRQIAEHIKNMIKYGMLPPGGRLSARNIAVQHGVGKGVVELAFDILKSEGYVEARARSGTYVSENAWLAMQGVDTVNWVKYSETGFYQSNREILHQANKRSSDPTVLDIGSCGFNIDEFDPYGPLDEAFEIIRGREYTKHFDTYDMRGNIRLREAAAAHMETLGVRTSPDNIMIFNGWQDACAVIFQSFLSHGSNVYIHANDMINAMRMLTSVGANVHSLAHDDEGILPSDLYAKAQGRKNSMFYANLVNHFPTGRTAGRGRRDELLSVIKKLNIPVVENGMMRDTWVTEPPPPLKCDDSKEQVIYIGSMDNVQNSGNKTAWAVVPSIAVERVCDVRLQYYGRNNNVIELLSYIMLSTGSYGRWAEGMRRKLPLRISAVDTLLQKHLGAVAKWRPGDIVYHAWLEFPAEIDVSRLFLECPGVFFLSGETYYSRSHILLNTISPSLDVLDKALYIIKNSAEKQINS